MQQSEAEGHQSEGQDDTGHLIACVVINGMQNLK